MAEFFQSLPDGWTIYLWLVVAAFILIAAGFMLRWAAKNNQFDEDIKYVVFDDTDRDKMSEEEFQKYKEVIEEQQKARQEELKARAKERNAKR